MNKLRKLNKYVLIYNIKWCKLKELEYLAHLIHLNFLIGDLCIVRIKVRNYGVQFLKILMF